MFSVMNSYTECTSFCSSGCWRKEG